MTNVDYAHFLLAITITPLQHRENCRMILGLDIGTTTVSGVLYHLARRRAVRTATHDHAAERSGLASGYHEQCPAKIRSAALQLVRSLATQAAEPVQAIALTGQMHGLLAVDTDLNPVTNLITWQDQRTEGAADCLRKHGYAAATGCLLHPGYGGLTLHHLVQTGTLPENAHRVLSVAGFIAASLTGRPSVDETFAASWGIWDVPGNAWHNALIAELQIPTRLLPQYVASCTELGTVADANGLGLAPGAMVYSPVGDNQAGVAGVLEGDTGEAVVNVGTSGQLSVPLANYAFSPQLETRPYPGGGFIQTYASLCGGSSYAYLAGFFQQVIEQIGTTEISLSEVKTAMDRFCESGDAGGLVVDNRFAGERHGPRQSGSITGINTKNLTPENLTRGVVIGMAAELAAAAGSVDLSAIRGLVAVGNAVRKNLLLAKVFEEQIGLPCRMVETPEEAATGAARSVARLKHSCENQGPA